MITFEQLEELGWIAGNEEEEEFLASALRAASVSDDLDLRALVIAVQYARKQLFKELDERVHFFDRDADTQSFADLLG